MSKIQFTYESYSPAPWCKLKRNRVTVWIQCGKIHYTREYISENGEFSSPILHTFDENATANEIAKMIHWGCSGTSKNAYELTAIIEKIKPIIESKNRKTTLN